MLHLGVRTTMSPEQVFERARKFFGPGGYGLRVAQDTSRCLTFENGGGGIELAADTDDGQTVVDITTREWEYQVREFLDEIT